MSTSGRSIKGLEKFINSDREKNSNEKIINNNLNNNNKFINSNNKISYNKNSNLIENNKLNNEKNGKSIQLNKENYNKINELIKEGIISLKENKNQIENFLDVNNIENMNYEKMIKKIINLNRSLKSFEAEKLRLNNEKSIFSKGLNEINQKRNIDDKEVLVFPNIKFKNNDNYSDKKEIIQNDGNKDELLKQYEEDLNFFNELINEFNEDLNILK